MLHSRFQHFNSFDQEIRHLSRSGSRTKCSIASMSSVGNLEIVPFPNLLHRRSVVMTGSVSTYASKWAPSLSMRTGRAHCYLLVKKIEGEACGNGVLTAIRLVRCSGICVAFAVCMRYCDEVKPFLSLCREGRGKVAKDCVVTREAMRQP
jgi:hypothetical protein